MKNIQRYILGKKISGISKFISFEVIILTYIGYYLNNNICICKINQRTQTFSSEHYNSLLSLRLGSCRKIISHLYVTDYS